MQREPAARQNMQQELREMGRALTVMNALLMRVRKALVHTNRRVVRGGARAGPSRAPSCSHLRRLFPLRGVPRRLDLLEDGSVEVAACLRSLLDASTRR